MVRAVLWISIQQNAFELNRCELRAKVFYVRVQNSVAVHFEPTVHQTEEVEYHLMSLSIQGLTLWNV